jgi:hypothetical protein
LGENKITTRPNFRPADADGIGYSTPSRRIDPATNAQAWPATLRLAGRHRLALYAAAYPRLALRRALPLATLDADQRAAANRHDVRLLGRCARRETRLAAL